MLEVTGLAAGYGKAQALWDVSLTVADGEIVTILGPNGAGKSTLVNTIAGITQPWDGSIVLDGTDLARTNAHAVSSHGVAVVPEGRRIFPEMNVADNLAVGAYNSRARPEHDETIVWVYEIFPRLEERSRQLAGSLSGGEQQMLAIGRALMARPRLLLLDEPSLGLAPRIIGQVFALIEELRRDGMTILLVEQNAGAAIDVADHVYVMANGHVTRDGPAADFGDGSGLMDELTGVHG